MKKDKASPGQISLFTQKEHPDAFRKAVQVLHSRPKTPLTLVQRKIGNAWIKYAIAHEPDDKDWWEIRIADLAEDIGFDSNNREHMREAARGLMSIVFEWDVLAKQKNRVNWKASVLFPDVEMTSEVVRYKMSGYLRKEMLNPEVYAMIDMNMVRRFRRGPSLAIWEFCVRFEKLNLTAEVPWEEFRDMIMGEQGDKTTYLIYKAFNSKVLKPAIAEINAETNHTIKLVETKSGRRVKGIRFEVSKKVEDQEANENVELIGELVKLGVPHSEAKKIVRNNNEKEVRVALDYTKDRLQDKKLPKLEKPAAYFRQALDHRYGAGREKGVKHEPEESTKVDVRRAFDNEQRKEAEGYFKELGTEDQAELISRYNEQQSVGSLKISKRTSRAANEAFYVWVGRQTWGEPSADELLQYAEKMLAKKN